MANKYAEVATRKNKASAPTAVNHSGAAVYGVRDETVLDRFLVLGAEGGTAYVGEREQVLEMVPSIERLLASDHRWVVDHTVAFSEAGRGVKNDPALFVLAMAASTGTSTDKAYALAEMPKVARTGTHILQFVAMVDKLRGWSRGLRTGIANWYTNKTVDQLAYQLVKYPNRGGWRQGDVLRSAHPTPVDTAMDQVFKFAVGRDYDATGIKWLEAHDKLQAAKTVKQVVALIEQYRAFAEIVPSQWQKEPDVWRAMLPNLGITAIVRNLGRMTAYGVLNGMSDADVYVQNALRDGELIKKGRLHPLTVLNGWMAYTGAVGDRKSSMEWRAVPQIAAAMEDAFYLSFDAVAPTGRRFVYGLDVSGSMAAQISGLSITCAQAVAAMSMVLARREQRYKIMAFNNGIEKLDITPKTDFKAMFRMVNGINGGGTNCALPMQWAMKEGVEADAFVVLTDNETNDYQWRGAFSRNAGTSPAQALKDYRQATGIDAALIVVAMTSTGFSIADPTDKKMLDVVGFSTDTPALINSFVLI